MLEVRITFPSLFSSQAFLEMAFWEQVAMQRDESCRVFTQLQTMLNIDQIVLLVPVDVRVLRIAEGDLEKTEEERKHR